MPKQFFDLSETAEIACCSKYTVRRWVKSGVLPAVIVASRYVIAAPALAKFLRRGTAKRKTQSSSTK